MSSKEEQEAAETLAAKTRINMKHGFMKLIVKNQVDRDKYDKEVKAAKTYVKPKNPVTSHSNGRNKKPDIQTYRPPNSRRLQSERLLLFNFEYEDETKEIHRLEVYKDDDPGYLARQFGTDRDFTIAMISALADFLRIEMTDALMEYELS